MNPRIKNGVAIEGLFKYNVQSGGASEAAQIRVKPDDYLLVSVSLRLKPWRRSWIA